MKKLNLFLILGLAVIGSTAVAQQRVALHSSGTTSVFSGANPFSEAYNAAIDGDTIYLPGGNIPYPTAINKGLVIYGAGHYPDYTEATAPTILNGGLSIFDGADNLKLEGIQINGNVNFATNQQVDNVVIRRCRIQGDLYYSGGSNFCENNTIYQCVIEGEVNLLNSRSGNFSNNIVSARVVNATDWGISNNIFFYPSPLPLQGVNNSFLAGNVFLYDGSNLYGGNLNTFTFNVFPGTPSIGNSTFENNYNETDLDGFFVNQSGNVFGYDQDYYLSNPGAFPGPDATVVGIYGGLYPYKEGAVPENPHFLFKDIDVQTNPSGQLNVNVQVEAQNE